MSLMAPHHCTAQQNTMQDYYAARALEYDQVYLKPERQADLRQMEAWVSECFAGNHVLELACGTGHWTRFIAQTASQLLATDAVAQTMALARQWPAWASGPRTGSGTTTGH